MKKKELNKENWTAIKGYEGRFEVSDAGRVRSLDRKVNSVHGPNSRSVKGRIRIPGLGANGYLLMNLEEKSHLLHRLVGIAFIPNPLNKPEINHKDGDKSNNKVSNLEWVTISENKIHRYRVLKQPPSKPMLGKKGLKIHNAKPVAEIHDGKIIAVFDCATTAANFVGTSQGRISCNARGESKTCHGRNFKYISRKEYMTLK